MPTVIFYQGEGGGLRCWTCGKFYTFQVTFLLKVPTYSAPSGPYILGTSNARVQSFLFKYADDIDLGGGGEQNYGSKGPC